MIPLKRFFLLLLFNFSLSVFGKANFQYTSINQEDSVKVTHLEEIEIKATNEEKEIKSSVPTYNISAEDIKQQGVVGIGDALRRLAGVTLKDYGGAGGMKTVAIRGLGAQHTGIAVDGLAVTDSRNGQIDLSRFSLENLSELSLHIGDSDDIFIPAKNASTPSLLEINSFNTSFFQPSRSITASFKFGSFQLYSGYLRWTQNISNNLLMSINGEFCHAKNNYPFRLRNLTLVTNERRSNSRMNSGNGEFNLQWRINKRTFANAKIHYYDNDRQLPGQVRFYTSFSRETLHDKNIFAQIGIRSQLPANFSIKGNLKYNWDNSSYRDPNYSGGVRDADYYQRETYATTSLLFSSNPDWKFCYSADYLYSNLTSFVINTPDTHPSRHSIYQTLTGRYYNGRFSATARLLLTLCYNKSRLDNHARDARRLSPSISLSYKLLKDESLYLRASFKDIFRLPTFTESYYYHFGSTDLKPEKTQQYNLGATWQHSYSEHNNFRLTVDGYINTIRDMIIAVPYNMFIWTNINLGKTVAKGVDITASIEHNLNRRQRIIFTANWSWQRILNRTDKNSPYYGFQPPYMPVNSGAASISWENPWINLTLSGTATSSRWSTSEHYDQTRIGGYTDFNLTLFKSIDFKKNKFDIRFDIRNLLNRQYEVIRLYPMPRINYQASLTWYFCY